MKNWKLYIVALCVLIAIAGVLFGLHEKALVDKQQSAVALQKKQVQAEATIIARKVDKQGLEHVTIEAARNVIPASQISTVAVSEGILDTTAMAIGILKKQIQELTRINFVSEARALKAERNIDSLNHVSFSYKNPWININYRPADSATREIFPNGHFGYQYNANLQHTQYWKRKKVLGIGIGRKESLIDFFLSDSNATINGVKRLSVVQDQPSFGLRLQSAIGYNFSTGAVSSGPGVQFDFNRFSVQGSYQYNFIEREWRPGLQARYDLVRF